MKRLRLTFVNVYILTAWSSIRRVTPTDTFTFACSADIIAILRRRKQLKLNFLTTATYRARRWQLCMLGAATNELSLLLPSFVPPSLPLSSSLCLLPSPPPPSVSFPSLPSPRGSGAEPPIPSVRESGVSLPEIVWNLIPGLVHSDAVWRQIGGSAKR